MFCCPMRNLSAESPRCDATNAPCASGKLPTSFHHRPVSKIIAIMSMSLDGYVADSHDGVKEVFDWYFNSGDVEIDSGGADPMTFRVSPPSAKHIRDLTS